MPPDTKQEAAILTDGGFDTIIFINLCSASGAYPDPVRLYSQGRGR